MNPLNSLFTGPENILWFAGGMLSVQLWQWIKCKWKDHKDPGGKPHPMKKFNWFYIWTAVVMVVIVGVSIQSGRTYSFVEELAKLTDSCQTETYNYLTRSREINAEDRKLDRVQEEAVLNRTSQLIALQDLYGSDPPYFDLKDRIDTEYFKKISQVEQRRIDLEQQRAVNPLPDPVCGKKKS